jgi:hypothetical protein
LLERPDVSESRTGNARVIRQEHPWCGDQCRIEAEEVNCLQDDGIPTYNPCPFARRELSRHILFLEAQMKFMIFVKSNPRLEKSIEEMSDSALKESMAKMNDYNAELKKAGVLKDCDGLRPSLEGKRVRFDGASRSVGDGPFQGDLVAGYWIWDLPNIEDAIAWVKRCPNPMPEPTEIEIRPI